MKRIIISFAALCAGIAVSHATQVCLEVNTVSPTVTLQSVETGSPVSIGSPDKSRKYMFETAPGRYLLTAYGTDGSTVNGTIVVEIVADPQPTPDYDGYDVQQLKLITCTAYATNSGWSADEGDYSLSVTVSSREGVIQEMVPGHSINSGRLTFLALEGHTYYATFSPSDAHRAEGYTDVYKSGTLNWNVNVSCSIPKAAPLSVTLPHGASLALGVKFAHFVDFTQVQPESVRDEGENTVYTYSLAVGQVYNYRASLAGGLTHAGYFTMAAGDKAPDLSFTEADFNAAQPDMVKHSVEANEGYETGDIFVNINHRNHLVLRQGEVFSALAMRTWQLTENQTNNYFMEPDFHYTVIDLDGKPSTDVIEVTQHPGSAWCDITAKSEGTAIVLVTYDAIALNYFTSSGVRTPYMGGEIWGAIWPENTAAYVVTVGSEATGIEPNMLINEAYNDGAKKLAGKYVDAEHDVFYYLDTEPGFEYTFTPQGADRVTIAYPTIDGRMATYTGFGTEGVTANPDGSYTVLLKEGRQIVRLSDASGHSVYQVLTAKPCHRTITNASRPGSTVFQPGDQIKIQYSGLRHPANKLAGIYNMSAYVTYNGIPNGSSLILGAGQYTFGSVPSAQAVTVDIPADIDLSVTPSIVMDDGVIQVNGYGDPIGNHRNIDRVAGRSPNFTAVPHKTYFGSIPPVTIQLTPYREFEIEVRCDVRDAEFTVLAPDGSPVLPDDSGRYAGSYGTYTVSAGKPGYRRFSSTYVIGDDADGLQVFEVNMSPAPEGAWDGATFTEPERSLSGVYLITTGAELAWYAAAADRGDAVLMNDIDLADYPWTPIGTSYSAPFAATFTGAGHTVSGLFIADPDADNLGLFGYAQGTAEAPAAITGVTVAGSVAGNRYVAGLLGCAGKYVTVDTCASYADVNARGKGAAGIVGFLSGATSSVSHCYNAGAVTASDAHAGIVGAINAGCTAVSYVFNVGTVSPGPMASACVGSKVDKTGVAHAYATEAGQADDPSVIVSPEDMASGQVAYLLGNPFGQLIGTDAHPRFGAPLVYYDEAADRYFNQTGILGSPAAIFDEAAPVRYYNLQGVGSTRPFRGYNIVVSSDGSARTTYIP